MDGPNIRRRQPRLWYTRARDKFIAEYRQHMEEQFTVLGDQIKTLTTQLSNMDGHNGNEFGDPSAERGTHRCQHCTQAHANQWENRFKLNIPEFQGWLQLEEFLVTEKIEKSTTKRCLKFGRTKNSTRQLHESFVIRCLCKCECRTHRERSLLKTNINLKLTLF
jgi:hypothetical protein